MNLSADICETWQAGHMYVGIRCGTHMGVSCFRRPPMDSSSEKRQKPGSFRKDIPWHTVRSSPRRSTAVRSWRRPGSHWPGPLSPFFGRGSFPFFVLLGGGFPLKSTTTESCLFHGAPQNRLPKKGWFLCVCFPPWKSMGLGTAEQDHQAPFGACF